MTVRLSEHELERFSRQLIVKGWSAGAQRTLSSLSISISPSLPLTFRYLLAAGATPRFLSSSMLPEPGENIAILGVRAPEFSVEDSWVISCQRDGSVQDGVDGKVYRSLPFEEPFNTEDGIPPSAQVLAALLLILRVMKRGYNEQPAGAFYSSIE